MRRMQESLLLSLWGHWEKKNPEKNDYKTFCSKNISFAKPVRKLPHWMDHNARQSDNNKN